MAEILHTLSIVSFVLAVIFIVIAIVIWFAFKISNVIGDLSGRNAKKSIERMRQNNERTGDKSYKASEKNLAREKLTGTMEGMGQPNNIEETGLLNENLAKEYDEQATGLLVDDATGLLDKSGETEALDENISIINRKPTSIIIQLVDEVMLVHTEEVI
jgi:Sec-independent protein translocase protein TatA